MLEDILMQGRIQGFLHGGGGGGLYTLSMILLGVAIGSHILLFSFPLPVCYASRSCDVNM